MQNTTDATQNPQVSADLVAADAATHEPIPDVVKEEQKDGEEENTNEPVSTNEERKLTSEEQAAQDQLEAQIAAYKAYKAKPWYVRMGDTFSEFFSNLTYGIDNTHRKTSEAFGTSPASCGLPPSEGGPSCVFHRPRENVQPTPEQLAVYNAQQQQLAEGQPVEGTVLTPEAETKDFSLRMGDTVSESIENIGRGMDKAHRNTSEAFGQTPASARLPPSEGGPSCKFHRPESLKPSAAEQQAKVQAIQAEHPYPEAAKKSEESAQKEEENAHVAPHQTLV